MHPPCCRCSTAQISTTPRMRCAAVSGCTGLLCMQGSHTSCMRLVVKRRTESFCCQRPHGPHKVAVVVGGSMQQQGVDPHSGANKAVKQNGARSWPAGLTCFQWWGVHLPNGLTGHRQVPMWFDRKHNETDMVFSWLRVTYTPTGGKSSCQSGWCLRDVKAASLGTVLSVRAVVVAGRQFTGQLQWYHGLESDA
eukprot:363096-Chlamydomonas_euryale.AAC.15